MIVERFYFGMIEAEEKYVLGLVFHIFLDSKWSYKLVSLHVMQNQTLNIWQGKPCVQHFLHDIKKLQMQVTS